MPSSRAKAPGPRPVRGSGRNQPDHSKTGGGAERRIDHILAKCQSPPANPPRSSGASRRIPSIQTRFGHQALRSGQGSLDAHTKTPSASNQGESDGLIRQLWPNSKSTGMSALSPKLDQRVHLVDSSSFFLRLESRFRTVFGEFCSQVVPTGIP